MAALALQRACPGQGTCRQHTVLRLISDEGEIGVPSSITPPYPAWGGCSRTLSHLSPYTSSSCLAEQLCPHGRPQMAALPCALNPGSHPDGPPASTTPIMGGSGCREGSRSCTGTIPGGCSTSPSPCEPTLGGLPPPWGCASPPNSPRDLHPPEFPAPDALPLKSAVHCNPAFCSCLASGLRDRAKKGRCRLRIALFMEDILGRNNVPALGIVGTLYFCHSGSRELRGRRGRLPAPRFTPS